MNEYLKAFQDVTHSTKQLLANEYHSLESAEIKQSAASLEKSIDPCIQEIKLSAVKLKELLQASFKELEHSQDVWESKSRVASAPQIEIWQQLGDISGCHFRIQRLSEHYKQLALKEAQDTWRKAIASLTNKYFFDQRRQLKKGIGYGEKDGFMRDIHSEIDSQANKISQIIHKYLNLIFQELDINYFKHIYSYFNLLDSKEKINLESKASITASEVVACFNNSITVSNTSYSPSIKSICQQTLDEWRKNWGDILWDKVVKFREEIAVKIEQRITLIFDDRLEVAKKALEQTISFYDILLARQERYQQETPVQRQAEKAWLEQQYQKLVQVQLGLEAILD